MRGLMIVTAAVLLAAIAGAAEPDPKKARLAEIENERVVLMLQRQNAQLLFEVVNLKLEKLAAEESKLKAEPKTESKKEE